MPRENRHQYDLTPEQAAQVRAWRAGGARWTEIADRLGWPLGNAGDHVRGALARSVGADGMSERARIRLQLREQALKDPIMSRECSVCGLRNFQIFTHHGACNSHGNYPQDFTLVPRGFRQYGGRWYCADCAPVRAPKPDPECPESGDPYRVGRIH